MNRLSWIEFMVQESVVFVQGNNLVLPFRERECRGQSTFDSNVQTIKEVGDLMLKYPLSCQVTTLRVVYEQFTYLTYTNGIPYQSLHPLWHTLFIPSSWSSILVFPSKDIHDHPDARVWGTSGLPIGLPFPFYLSSTRRNLFLWIQDNFDI